MITGFLSNMIVKGGIAPVFDNPNKCIGGFLINRR